MRKWESIIPMFNNGCPEEGLEPSKLVYRMTDLKAIRTASVRSGSLKFAM